MTLYRGNPLSLEAESFRIDPQAVCYRGYSTSAVTAIGTTWAPYTTNVAETVDEEQSGVFRSGAIFSFALAGLYCAQITLGVSTVNPRYYGMRLWNGLTMLQQVVFYDLNAVDTLMLQGPFRVYTPSDAALEVCAVGGSANTFAASAIDGEPGRTMTISLTRIAA